MAGFGIDRSSVASGSGASAASIAESIIDAKGDLIAGSAADTPVRVAVGTDEKRLVADSAQAAGVGYVADTTNYAVAAKGDLLAGTAADTVAPVTVGAAGEMLMAASGVSTGLAWLRFPSAGAFLINGKITRSVAASALTLAVKTLGDADPSTSSPVYVLMPTATSNVLDGGYVIRSITGALSMTVSSGSTLGHASGVASPVYVYLLDNAGTLELAVSNKFFGAASVQTTTAEGGAGAADSATVLYSTTLRSNVVVVPLQRWSSTQTTAGTWAATTGEVVAYRGGDSLASLMLSPEFTGTPIAPTAAADTNTTQLATTAFVLAQAASQAELETGTSTSKFTSAGRQHFHASALKGWANLTFGGTADTSFNVSTVDDTGAGTIGINWATDFSGADYAISAVIINDLVGTTTDFHPQIPATGLAAGFTGLVAVRSSDSTAVDATAATIMVSGDQ